MYAWIWWFVHGGRHGFCGLWLSAGMEFGGLCMVVGRDLGVLCMRKRGFGRFLHGCKHGF